MSSSVLFSSCKNLACKFVFQFLEDLEKSIDHSSQRKINLTVQNVDRIPPKTEPRSLSHFRARKQKAKRNRKFLLANISILSARFANPNCYQSAPGERIESESRTKIGNIATVRNCFLRTSTFTFSHLCSL